MRRIRHMLAAKDGINSNSSASGDMYFYTYNWNPDAAKLNESLA